MKDNPAVELKLNDKQLQQKIRLTMLIREIQKEERLGFHMDTYFSWYPGKQTYHSVLGHLPPANTPVNFCGSVCCIAGLIYYNHVEEGDRWISHASASRIFGFAKDWLGLTPKQANALFTPCISGTRNHLTRAHAVRVLRTFRDEGVIDWPRAMNEEKANV